MIALCEYTDICARYLLVDPDRVGDSPGSMPSNVVNPRNQFVGSVGNFLFKVTEPVLAPIRRVLPDLGGIDISPIVVLIILFF